MAKKFSELEAKMSPERREWVKQEVAKALAEMPLNIAQNVVNNKPLGPITKQLAGIIKLEENINHKELLADTLMEKYCMAEKINRNQVIYSKQELLDESDNEYWKNASIEEKLQTITYLRECFYGKTATTGRLQRIYTMSKLKQC